MAVSYFSVHYSWKNFQIIINFHLEFLIKINNIFKVQDTFVSLHQVSFCSSIESFILTED